MDAGETEEIQLALDVLLDLAAPVFIDRIPFIHRQHQGASGLDGETGDMRILIRDFLASVHHQHHHIALFYRLQGFDHREFLYRLEHLAAAAQPCRVDQRIGTAVALERHFDRVARRTRHVEGNDPLFAEQGIDQRAFSDIGAPGDGDAGTRANFRFFTLFREGRKRFLDQLAHPLAVRRRNNQRDAATEFVKLRGKHRAVNPLALIHHQQQRPAALSQAIGDDLVLGRDPGPTIDDE